MKGKKEKLSRPPRKSRSFHPEEIESHEMFIDLKNYVDALNSDIDAYYFNVQALYNGRFIDKQGLELAKDLRSKVEEPPFLDPTGLSQMQDSPEGDKVEIVLGISFDKSVQSIEYLRIEEAEVNDEPFLHYCFSISSKYDTISKLHLIDCCLNAKSIETIAKQLTADNNTIKDLSLDLNVVPEQNYHLLIDGTTLEHLSLRHCGIDCRGAKLISQALEYKKPYTKLRLLSLALNGNGIEDSGLFYITMALRTNFKLHYLSLASNLITDSGIEMIAGIMKKFPISPQEDRKRRFMFIKYLESAANQHGKECIDSIYNAVEKCSFLFHQRIITSSNEVDIQTSIDDTRNQEDNISQISNSFISLANIVNGDLHPLLTTVYREGDMKYCVGNFALAFLNLSYNYFGKIGMHALIEAARYQSNVGSQINGFGLMGVKAEGLKNVDRENEELNNILSKRSITKLYDRRHLINQPQNDIQEK